MFMGMVEGMAFTSPIVKGRRRPRYRFNIELPDALGAKLEKESARQGVAKRTIIVHLLLEELSRSAKDRDREWARRDLDTV